MCGLKDSFAVTTQEMTVRGVSMWRLRAAANHSDFPSHCVISNFRKVLRTQRPGKHHGNRFQIVVRDVAAGLTPQAFAAAVSAVSDGGFINYLGMQVSTVPRYRRKLPPSAFSSLPVSLLRFP